MVNIEDAPRLRELCEKASKEYDHEKLIELIRQISELLQKRRRDQGDPGKQASAFPGSTSFTGYPHQGSDRLDLYGMTRPAVA